MLDYLTTTSRRRLRNGTRAFTRVLDIGDARVFVDHGFQWDGVNNVWLTRARASYVVGAGPEFDLRPRGFLSRVLGIELGSPSGDPPFDDFFVVRSRAADRTYDALTTRVRSLLATEFDDARLMSDGRMIVLWREADFGREADAEAAAELVSEIARFESEALAALRSLPGSLYVAPSGPWDARRPPAAYTRSPATVRIAPVNREGRAVMSASAPCGREAAPFRVAIAADGAPDSLGERPGVTEGPIEQFPGVIGAGIEQIGPCVIECNRQEVTLTWGGLERNRQRLLAGASLIGELARTHSSGLYR